jgi:(p)ppGpp synthase/HD superfamily hydrolase
MAATVLTDRLYHAIEFAGHLHRLQIRKMTQTPYVSHLLSVTALVLENGGDEDMAIAAMLHDALEDQAAAYTQKTVLGADVWAGPEKLRQDISFMFGARVLSIVEELTETDEDPKPPWRERKEKYLAHLEVASPEAILIAGSDKLHNARTTLTDKRQHGNKVWEKFNSDRDSQIWWYYAVLGALRNRNCPAALTDELEEVLSDLFRQPWFGG